MDTTDSSVSNCNPTTLTPPVGPGHTTPSSSQGHLPSSPINRLSRTNLERRASNPNPGDCASSGPSAATVLMMRRRVSSNSWSTDPGLPQSPTSMNNNNNSSFNNYNLGSVGTGCVPNSSNVIPHSARPSHLPAGTAATALRKEREQQRLFPNSPVSTLVDDALMQMNLKRSSSAPMINQLGIQKESNERFNSHPHQNTSGLGTSANCNSTHEGGSNRETSMDIDVSSFTNSFLASLNNPRPRRFSASFCPGSPGPAPNRVSQLRNENATDWEALGEKEFLGTVNMAQSWEDLSLDPMEIGSRRPSFSDQLWLSMPPGSSSASSSPAVSPRVLSRFSPSLSSPSPTRKSFTTRRSLSPIAVRPSVLAVGQGVKRKCDWDSSSSSNNQMDTSSSPQPAPKRIGGLLSLSHGLSITSHRSSNNSSPTYTTSHFGTSNHLQPFQHLLRHRESPNSLETGTESSVSSVSGGGDSPFFRPLDSPMNSPSDSSDSPHSLRKT